MASTDIVIVTVTDQRPVVVAADAADLVGQIILDYADAHPTVPEFAVNVKIGTAEA